MAHIKITRGTIVNGKAVEVGELITTTEADARLLVAIGKAVPVTGGGGGVDEKPGLTTESAAPIARKVRQSKDV